MENQQFRDISLCHCASLGISQPGALEILTLAVTTRSLAAGLECLRRTSGRPGGGSDSFWINEKMSSPDG